MKSPSLETPWLLLVLLGGTTLAMRPQNFSLYITEAIQNHESLPIFPTTNWERIVTEAQKIRYPMDDYWKRFQDRIPATTQFPCAVASWRRPRWRSETRPKSVHRLRPGDVDVVGAIGDSLTVATAAREYLLSFSQDRGVSFTGGGLGTWRDITTMPNILKVFNPKLVGHSVGSGDFLSSNAQLNVAITSAIDDDTLVQAKLFVKKMKQDPRIKFSTDWKLLSIFVGHNDICSMSCLSGQHTAKDHKHQLQSALDYLYKEVPRLFVNLIAIIDPNLTARMETNAMCNFMRRIGCSCLYQKDDMNATLVEMSRLTQEYHEAEKQLVFSGRYDGREDFTVELQPFMRSTLGPRRIGQKDNLSLIKFLNEEKLWTPECFHLNQRGLAIAAILLWNNMMEPANSKSIMFQNISYDKIKCPTKEAPYLFTRRNSKTYYILGHQ